MNKKLMLIAALMLIGTSGSQDIQANSLVCMRNSSVCGDGLAQLSIGFMSGTAIGKGTKLSNGYVTPSNMGVCMVDAQYTITDDPTCPSCKCFLKKTITALNASTLTPASSDYPCNPRQGSFATVAALKTLLAETGTTITSVQTLTCSSPTSVNQASAAIVEAFSGITNQIAQFNSQTLTQAATPPSAPAASAAPVVASAKPAVPAAPVKCSGTTYSATGNAPCLQCPAQSAPTKNFQSCICTDPNEMIVNNACVCKLNFKLLSGGCPAACTDGSNTYQNTSGSCPGTACVYGSPCAADGSCSDVNGKFTNSNCP